MIAHLSHLPFEEIREPGSRKIVLEGGGIETDGQGTLLVTEEWLLSEQQVRNPGYSMADYEKVFRQHLGMYKVVWLGQGCVGDDTHGHIDDIVRFCEPGHVILAYDYDATSDNHSRSQDNFLRLKKARLEVSKIPFPRKVIFDNQQVPASYANFYIANQQVLAPTFNDPNDLVALKILEQLFPKREIVPISCVDLIWGLGTIHCATQQQPA